MPNLDCLGTIQQWARLYHYIFKPRANFQSRVHPSCGNCTKHGVRCDFEAPKSPLAADTPSSGQQTSDGSSNYNSSTPGSQVSGTIIPFYQKPTEMIRIAGNSGVSRSLELKLMHHFTACTSYTFADTDEQRFAWQVAIPQIAYDAPYLMDALLSVSALHMRTLHPADLSLARASHAYMASTLSQYSGLLSGGLSKVNSEALFATSALIAFEASASRRFEDELLNGHYTLPLAWFHSFQGVKTVVMSSWQWLRSSEKVFPIINSLPALFLDLDEDRKLFFAPLLEDLDEEVALLPQRLQADTKQAYIHSVAYLNWAHQKPQRNRILGFAATVSRRFVELLASCEPRAIMIVACFFALTKVVDEVWWLDGVAQREINGLLSILPRKWWGKIQWAMEIARHQGPMDEVTWGVGGNKEEVMKPENADEAVNVHLHIDILANMLAAGVPEVPLD